MKLVQLLAKELKEWPVKEGEYNKESDYCVQSDKTSQVFFCGSHGEIFLSERADETSGVRVTISEWQAEREKMNKPKWIRHRGGKCPVADDVKVLYRMRSGTIASNAKHSCNLRWDHSKVGGDIMAYRVIEETKDQEIEEVKVADVKLEMLQGDSLVTIGSVSSDFGASVFDGGQPAKGEEVKKTNFGTITYKLEIDATDANKEIDSLVAKWGQIESPLKWRDAIIHCQAIIEDCEREIERNVNLLDAEGLMMQKDSKKAMQHYAPDIDFSDWRNWQAGDIVECVTDCDNGQFTFGARYAVKSVNLSSVQIVEDDRGSNTNGWGASNFKFSSRP